MTNQRRKKKVRKAAKSRGKSLFQLYHELLGLREAVQKAERKSSKRSPATQ
jgi:hypothetical protein